MERKESERTARKGKQIQQYGIMFGRYSAQNRRSGEGKIPNQRNQTCNRKGNKPGKDFFIIRLCQYGEKNDLSQISEEKQI